MKAISFVAVLSLASAMLAATTPAGWKVLIDKTKNCQIAVPPDWVVSQYSPSMADSPDKKANIIMHGTNQGQTLEMAKQVMESTNPPTKVIEDTKDRLWYEYTTSSGNKNIPPMNWYVGIPVKGNVCGVQISFGPGMEPVMKQIAESLAGAK
jgi:hypothetical protein